MTTAVKIAFGATNYGPMWRPAVETWLRVMAYTQRELIRSGRGEIAAIGVTDRTYTHSANNTLARDFLADESLTHLALTECDMLLPDAYIMKLLALDKPIASGVYFLRGGNGQPCLYVRALSMANDNYGMSPVSVYPTATPFRLRGCPGLGCLLIQRAVFETLIDYPWFDLAEGKFGSDLYFFTNALKKGVETWIDPRVRCGQIEYKVWGYEDYEERLKTDPTYAQHGYVLGMPPEMARVADSMEGANGASR